MSGTRVLIVEDEAIIAMDIESRLSRMGYEVVGKAGNGLDALRMAVEREPDVVLMDIHLRGDIDGVEAAARIKERTNVPLVFVTGHSDSGTLERAKRTEPAGYLLKPIQDDDLRVNLTIAFHNHQVAQELRDSEKWLTATIQSCTEAIITTTAEGAVETLNPQAEILTGIRQTDAVQQPLTNILRLYDLESKLGKKSPAAAAFDEHQDPGVMTALLEGPNSRQIPVEYSAAAIREKGRVMGAIVTIRDISPRHRKFRRALEQTRMEAVSKVVAGIVRELETQRSAERAPNLLAPFVEKLRILSQTDLLAMEVVDLNQWITTNLPALKVQARPRNLEARLLAEKSSVRIAPVRLALALEELIRNACEASPIIADIAIQTLTVTMEPGAESRLRAGHYVQLSVLDRGRGMSDLVRQHASDPFFTTKKVGGPGLGLAIVLGIVAQAGGQLEIETEEGNGTTVEILLPYEPVKTRQSQKAGLK